MSPKQRRVPRRVPVEPIYHNWHEEGGGVIYPIDGKFHLYEVPQFGGEERFVKECETLDEAKKIADSWT